MKDLGFKRSPNHRSGRSGWENKADIIVHHVTEGAFNGAVSWLCNTLSQASAHFVTAKDGSFIQLVDLANTAWCNGNGPTTIGEALNSLVKSRPNANANMYTFSIENEGWSYKDNFGVPTGAQREALRAIHKRIVDYILSYNPKWRASRETVIGHCHIRSRAKPSCPTANHGEKYPWDDIITEINNYIDLKQGGKNPESIMESTSTPVVEVTPPATPDYSAWPGITKHNGMKGHQIPFVLEIAPAMQASLDKGILISVRMAQAILETGWGTSKLAKEANNLFGVKADNRWQGPVYNTQTGEWSAHVGSYTINAPFRAYDTKAESVLDQAEFLQAPRYAAIIGDKDYKSVAKKIKDAGYATDPDYTSKLISVIETNSLHWFDTLGSIPIKNTEPQVPESNLPIDTVAAAGMKVGSVVRVKQGATTYDGRSPAAFVYEHVYQISSYSGDRVVLDSHGINSPYNVHDLILIGAGIPSEPQMKVGSLVKIKPGAKWSVTPEKDVPAWAMASIYRIDQLDGTKALLNKDGINSPIDTKFLMLAH